MRKLLVRLPLVLLAVAHAFPSAKHGQAFLAEPSLGEFWKAALAPVAVCTYLVPPERLARAIVKAWRCSPRTLGALAVVLVVVHLVPAFDHVPRFMVTPTWADAWRGIGASLASLWFTLSVPFQARIVGALGAGIGGRPRDAKGRKEPFAFAG
jgi:hypothetical protein